MTRADERTDQIFAMIERFIAREGHPPSIREIADACHISSVSVVQHHLDKLERKRRILRHRGISRGIEIVRPKYGTITRPYLDGENRRAALRQWKEKVEEELFWVIMQLEDDESKESLG